MKYLAIVLLAFVVTTSGASYGASGMASYYGGRDGLCGSRMASGKRLDCRGLSAAHRTLPFGTRILVTHKGRSVCVTISDRGPFIKGRVLDLSLGAAKVIGLTERGVGRVSYLAGC